MFRLIRSRARRRAAAASKQSPQKSTQQSAKKKISDAEIKKWYRDAIREIVTARLERESDPTLGEAVFLSHYISNGQFRHWALHVHRHKYELRELRQRNDDDSSPKPPYEDRISSSDFNLEKYQKSIRSLQSPEFGSYFYSLIGWTKLSKEEVDLRSHEVFASFGTYALLFNNCQNFLLRLAERIMTKKAPDWDWFRQHAVGGYHYIKHPALGYDIISAATWSENLAREKHHLDATGQQEIDNFIIVLETHLEKALTQTVTSLALNTTQTTNVDASNSFHHDGGNGGGHGGGDGGGGGGGGC